MAISVSDFAAQHPTLWHMAHRDSWPSIHKHGLLCTSALLDLFQIRGAFAERVRSRHRAESIVVENPSLGFATIRDQKPMSDNGLKRALRDDLTPTDWYRLLNNKVFFWPSEERLQRMMRAPPYRDDEHIVLVVNTRRLLSAKRHRVTLSPLNSGATRPMPHPRGLGTFQGMASYPYWERKRKGLAPVAEVAIDDRVENVERFLRRVERGIAGSSGRTVVWSPALD